MHKGFTNDVMNARYITFFYIAESPSLVIGTIYACALKLLRNIFACEKDEELVSFINMRVKALRECLD